MFQLRAREGGFLGARDGRASINFRVLYQLINQDGPHHLGLLVKGGTYRTPTAAA